MKIDNIKTLQRWCNGGFDEVFIENEITLIVDWCQFKVGTVDGKIQMYDLSAGDIQNFLDVSDNIKKSYTEAVNRTAPVCWYELTNMKDWKESYIPGWIVFYYPSRNHLLQSR